MSRNRVVIPTIRVTIALSAILFHPRKDPTILLRLLPRKNAFCAINGDIKSNVCTVDVTKVFKRDLINENSETLIIEENIFVQH